MSERQFNQIQAATLPTAQQVTGQTVNVTRIESFQVERSFLYSMSRAMKYAEFLRINARDVDGDLVKNSLPLPTDIKSIPDQQTLLEEYTDMGQNREGEIEVEFSEFVASRNPNVADNTYRNIIRGMGLVDERNAKFGDDLESVNDG